MIIMVIIFTIIICYRACVLFQVGAQFSLSLGWSERGWRMRILQLV